MTLTVSESVVWTEADDEVRLYDASTGEFQTLNASAAQIWRLVAQGRAPDEIVAELTARFADGDAHEAMHIDRDVTEFLQTLRAAGLVQDAG